MIGGGPGGYVGSIVASQNGLKTACVEGRGALGGTCLNVGCIPSKALLHSSEMYHEAKHSFASHGIKVSGDVTIDLPAMMKQKDTAVKGLTGGIEGLFKKNKVTYVKGWGKITAPGSVQVTKEDGSQEVVSAKNIIIATGSDVADIPTVPRDEERIVSSTGALTLKEIPKRMIVIGAGVIGMEMGSVWSRLGSEVTVVEFAKNPIAVADADIVRAFKRTMEKQGVKFMLETGVQKAERKGDVVELTVAPAKGGDPQVGIPFTHRYISMPYHFP